MIALRAATPDDAGAIAAIYAPHVTAGIASFELEAPDAAIMAARMASAGELYPWLVATEGPDGAVLGYAYAGRFREREAYRWTVETTIYLASHAHRRGIGRQLYEALIATLTRQGFTQAIGAIALPNPGSVALHETLGFVHAGTLAAVGYKLGQWADVGYWQRALAPAALPPAEPLPVTGLLVLEP
ncbi:GNAT family N-acetyltransferase [Sphingomonas aerophila]|uniref:Phosphinothricin acetyltransferase n=1 Tax=Sphingomonas aerophila TaxID=1344948 RepID=A0A7W9BBL3_9SPHN|nr:phosphinothricin acetyltransferase [Sphingomonas aerophila]